MYQKSFLNEDMSISFSININPNNNKIIIINFFKTKYIQNKELTEHELIGIWLGNIIKDVDKLIIDARNNDQRDFKGNLKCNHFFFIQSNHLKLNGNVRYPTLFKNAILDKKNIK